MSDVRFPDGTMVRGCAAPSQDENEDWRDFGLYLDPAWEPTCPAVLIDWPDRGVPVAADRAKQEIEAAFELARQGKHVEVGCLGGIGRTGTVLACMAILAGVPRDQAVEWIRENYSAYAVEEPDQEAWVEWFGDAHAATSQ